MFSLFSAYPTFMIFLGVAIAMVITMVLMPAWIRFLKTSHIGQQVRADGPQSHLVKQGSIFLDHPFTCSSKVGGSPVVGVFFLLRGLDYLCIFLVGLHIHLVVAARAMKLLGVAVEHQVSAAARTLILFYAHALYPFTFCMPNYR